MALWDYNGCACQRWTTTFIAPLATKSNQQLTGVSIYPVPTEGGKFTVELGNQKATAPTTVLVYNSQGQQVYQQKVSAQQTTLAMEAALKPGVYIVQVQQSRASSIHKISVQ